jgi:hypothetical protein
MDVNRWSTAILAVGPAGILPAGLLDQATPVAPQAGCPCYAAQLKICENAA